MQQVTLTVTWRVAACCHLLLLLLLPQLCCWVEGRSLTLGALVAALAAHKDLSAPWNELLKGLL